MPKYLNDAPSTTFVDFTKSEQSEPCDTCRRFEGCEFAPDGINCINRLHVQVSNDDAYEWRREHIEETYEVMRKNEEQYNARMERIYQ